MKTRSLSTVLMSAYLSAMLASSLAPMAGNITLAGTVNPVAAQAAFREALVGANAAGWTAVAAADIPAPPKAEPQIIARSAAPSDPVLTDELLARLLKLIGQQVDPGSIPANICPLFNLCDGTTDLKLRLLETDNPKGDFIGMPMKAGATDILVMRQMADGSVQYYLTDKSRKLRAAVVAVNRVGRLVLNETVAKNYEATLSHLAKEAADLPPSGTSVAAAGS